MRRKNTKIHTRLIKKMKTFKPKNIFLNNFLQIDQSLTSPVSKTFSREQSG